MSRNNSVSNTMTSPTNGSNNSKAKAVVFTPRGVLPSSCSNRRDDVNTTTTRASIRRPHMPSTRSLVVEGHALNLLAKELQNHQHRSIFTTTLPSSTPPSSSSYCQSPHYLTSQAAFDNNNYKKCLKQRSADDIISNQPPPVIDVKLVDGEMQQHQQQLLQMSQRRRRRRPLSTRSIEDFERHLILTDDVTAITGSGENYFRRGDRVRSSFLGDDERPAVYEPASDDVQTVLNRPSCIVSASPSMQGGAMTTGGQGQGQGEEHIYSLPQCHCCNDEAASKAVKTITDKYDSADRRKLHATCFIRQDDSRRPSAVAALETESRMASDPASEIGNQTSLTAARDLTYAVSTSLALTVTSDSSVQNILCPVSGLTSNDVTRIEFFYRSLETEVYVGKCMADVFFGHSPCLGASASSSDLTVKTLWNLQKAFTGVPVFVLSTGCLGRTRRELRLVVAELHTGFMLWQDKLNYLSGYTSLVENPMIHQLRLSESLRTVVQLKFRCTSGANEFARIFADVTRNPADELWQVRTLDVEFPKKSANQNLRSKQILLQRQLPAKKDISAPCNFVHVTAVNQSDTDLIAYLLKLTLKARNINPSQQ